MEHSPKLRQPLADHGYCLYQGTFGSTWVVLPVHCWGKEMGSPEKEQEVRWWAGRKCSSALLLFALLQWGYTLKTHHILCTLAFFSRTRLIVPIKIKNYFHEGEILAEESIDVSNSLPGWSGSIFFFFPVRAGLDSFSNSVGCAKLTPSSVYCKCLVVDQKHNSQSEIIFKESHGGLYICGGI